jgi:hypothetical protein
MTGWGVDATSKRRSKTGLVELREMVIFSPKTTFTGQLLLNSYYTFLDSLLP